MNSDVKISALREEHSKILSEMQSLARKIQHKIEQEDDGHTQGRRDQLLLPMSYKTVGDLSPGHHQDFSINLSQINGACSDNSPASLRDSMNVNMDTLKRTMKIKVESILNSIDGSIPSCNQMDAWGDGRPASSRGWKVQNLVCDCAQAANEAAGRRGDWIHSSVYKQNFAELRLRIASLERDLEISRQDSNFQAQELIDCETRLHEANAVIARQQKELSSLRKGSEGLKMIYEQANSDLQQCKKDVQTHSLKAMSLESDLNALSIRFNYLHDEKMELQNSYFLCREELQQLKEQRENVLRAVSHHQSDSYTSPTQDRYHHSNLSDGDHAYSNVGILNFPSDDELSDRQLSLLETVRARPKESMSQDERKFDEIRHDALIEDCRTKDAEIEQLKFRLSQLSSEHSSLREHLIGDVKSMSIDSTDISNELACLRVEWSSQLDRLDAEVLGLRRESQVLRSEAASLSNKNQVLQTQLNDCKDMLDENCSELTELRQKDLHSAMKLTFLNAELDACKHQLDVHRGEVQHLQEELVKAQQLHTDKAKEVYDLRVEKESLTQQVYDLRGSLLDTSKSLEKSQSEIQSQAEAKKVAEGKLNEVQAQCSTACAERQILDNKYKAVCGELKMLQDAQRENRLHIQTIDLLHARLEAQNAQNQKVDEAVGRVCDVEGEIERLLNLYQEKRGRELMQERSHWVTQDNILSQIDGVVKNLCHLHDIMAGAISNSMLSQETKAADYQSTLHLCLTEFRHLTQEIEKLRFHVRKDEAARLELEDNKVSLLKELRNSEHQVSKLEETMADMATRHRVVEEKLSYLLSSTQVKGEYDAAIDSKISEYDSCLDEVLTQLDQLHDQVNSPILTQPPCLSVCLSVCLSIFHAHHIS